MGFFGDKYVHGISHEEIVGIGCWLLYFPYRRTKAAKDLNVEELAKMNAANKKNRTAAATFNMLKHKGHQISCISFQFIFGISLLKGNLRVKN